MAAWGLRASAEPPAAIREPSVRGLANDKAVAAFYQPDEVQSVHLHVAEKDLKRMLAALPELIEVPASFRWRDITVENVSIRFKGNSSSNPNQTHKRSFLIKFDQSDKDRRFFGLRQVSFDNGIQFGSLFSEPIITDILRDLRIPAHRCNYAKLYVNEEYRGVYVNVERIDESFLENHLSDASGSLFKVDEGGPGCNLQFLGDDPALYSKTFAAKTHSAKKNPGRLVEFIKLINATEPKQFAKALESKMEVDDFLRVMAVMLFSGAFDQLTGWNPHNYFLYHDAKRDRWRYLPWDLDVGFCETAFDKIRVHADWHAAWPMPATGTFNPLLERIVDDPVLLERYRKEARRILDRSFEPEKLCQAIDAKYRLIKGNLKTDPFPHRRVTVSGDRSYDDIVDSMKAFVRMRYASAVKQLEKPGERPKIERRPPGLPPQFIGKIQRIEKRVQRMQRDGQDVSPVLKLMQRVGPAVQEGKLAEAEKIADEVLKLIGEKER
jgi:spore coat protein CotH